MDKTIIITGCASGIGRHLAGELFRRGHLVIATDVNEEGLERAAREGGWLAGERVLLAGLDVRDPAAWDRVIEKTVSRWGRVDVLMNVAGYLVPVWAHEAKPEDVDRTVDVNVKGLMHGTNAAVRQMLAQGSGHIINIASMAGIVPVPGIAIYSASKHAARAYSIAVGQEVRPHNVYVTAVCPGVVATPMMDIQIDREEATFTFSGTRALTVEEVAHAIVNKAMPKKPLELVVPAPGTPQGAVSKIANLFPELGLRLGDRVRAIGRQNQRKLGRSV